ncbi:hypothetical protein ACFWIO_10365 [Streptomyces diastatochromogenes]|uniref:hypothetical protein n=1 Tax=Streptomyces diastatochromogenes TaxID=42236 RepID=UPI003654912C
MHRTTTTAALLVTVAVSALSGCVTVPSPATPGPPPDTAPSQPTAPRPDGSAEPRVVQAPAREALAMVGPSKHPHHAHPSAAPHRAPAAPPVTHRSPTPPAHPRPHPHPHPDHPRKPRVDLPDVSQPVPKAPDVCALGKQYGGWRGDSPEAVICEQTYGH